MFRLEVVSGSTDSFVIHEEALPVTVGSAALASSVDVPDMVCVCEGKTREGLMMHVAWAGKRGTKVTVGV